MAAPSEPAGAFNRAATWLTCDGRLLARFSFGATRPVGAVDMQTSAWTGISSSTALAGGLPAFPGTVPLAYLKLTSLSAAAAVTYAAPGADRSLIVSPAIARGASYEIVGYERPPFGSNAAFRVVYQSAVYAASSPGVLFITSPLAGLTIARATPVYFELLSVPLLTAVPSATVEPFQHPASSTLVPSLAISKADNGGTAGWTLGQTGASYTLKVNNSGSRATSGTIVVIDRLPPGLTLSGAPSGTGWGTCAAGTAGGTELICYWRTALAPGASSPALTVPVNVGATTRVGIKSITNTALSYGGGDPSHATSKSPVSASDSTTITVPVLAVSKTDNGGTPGWTLGQSGASYLLTISNRGTRATSGTIVVIDRLPPGLTLRSAPGGTGWGTCASGTAGGTELICYWRTALAPGASSPALTVPVNVGATTRVGIKSITNTALSYGGGDPVHATSKSPVSASDSTTITGLPLLGVSKTDNGGTTGWTLGQSGASYTLTVSNGGTGATVGTIVVIDRLPPGLTLSGAPSGTGWGTCAAGTAGGTELICYWRTPLAPGASSAALTVPVTVGPATRIGIKSITNTALSYGGGDALHATSKNPVSASDSTTIAGIPTLSLSKTDNGGTSGWTIDQSGAAYTLTVSNTGTGATSGTITVSDTPPPGIFSTGAFSGAGWDCSLGKLLFTCTWATALAPGASTAALTVPVAIGLNAPVGTNAITNTAMTYGGGDPLHTSPSSAATASDSTTITGIPVLSLSKTDNGGTTGWTIGQSGASYTLTVGNTGTLATSGTITVSDTLPQGLTLSAPPSGPGWACTGASGSAVLSCTSTTAIATNASGAAITVPVNVGSTTPTGTKSVANTASAFGGGDPLHATSANSVTASDSTTVTGVPSLSLTKTDNSGAGWLPKQVGSAYTLTVSNTGTGPTAGAITVSDTLPSGLTLSGNPSPSGWVCPGSAGDTSISCTLSTALAPGTSAPPITVPVYVGGNTPEGANAISNTATAYGGGDPVHTSTNPAKSNVDATTIVYTAPNIFVADRGQSGSGGIYELLATGSYNTASQLGSGFSNPVGVAVDGFGNAYVADTGNNAIKLIDGGVFTFGSGFNGPEGVAVDAAGNIYVSDSNNNAVKEIPVGNGTPITLGSGFHFPIGLAVDGAGNVYVADSGNSALKEIPAGNGTPITLVSGEPGSSLLCGTFVPVGVAVDQAGNLFVANIGPDGPYTVDYLPKGKGTCVGIGPQPNSFGPGGIAVDAADNVYVTNDGNGVGVYEIFAAGGYTTIKQLYAGFGNPTGIAVAPASPSSAPRTRRSR